MSKISITDVVNGIEKCPNDGNRILLYYRTKDGVPESLRCTHCFNDFERNGDFYYQVDFYKNKVKQFPK